MQLMFTVRQHIRLISIIWKLDPASARLVGKDLQNSNLIHVKLPKNCNCNNDKRIKHKLIVNFDTKFKKVIVPIFRYQ